MAAKEAGNMVDLDSNPTKLIEVVAIGKQLLMTRGALTTFSIANDVAKYFAIIPAMFMATYPALARSTSWACTRRRAPCSPAVIFNALIIIVLVPLALRGVKYRPDGRAALLRRNLLIYGVGGIIAPFPGIWLIDRLLVCCISHRSNEHVATFMPALRMTALLDPTDRVLFTLEWSQASASFSFTNRRTGVWSPEWPNS